MNYEEYLQELIQIYEEYKIFDTEKIPLCAAENYVSPFAKQGLISAYEGKYISGYLERDIDKDFIGSDYLEKILNYANKLASLIFHSKYNDFRTLTGMNTVALVLMSMIKKGAKIAITDPSSGGHGSLPKLCDNYGIKYISIPYDYNTMQIDYSGLNNLLATDSDISYIFFCQSDIIQPPELSKIEVPENVGIIYDATQTLGLIAGGQVENPLDQKNNILMIGGTHKTFPGVTCGFIATNNDQYIKQLNKNISPNFLRNVQVNNIISVCFSMIELLKFGKSYAKDTVYIANKLGEKLSSKNIYVKQIQKNLYTTTHQLFIGTGQKNVDETYKDFKKYGITLNKRKTEYINGFRLGVQEIARYDFKQHLDELADLIFLVLNNPEQEKEIYKIKSELYKLKVNMFSIDNIFMELD